jgi:hypothetical protein
MSMGRLIRTGLFGSPLVALSQACDEAQVSQRAVAVIPAELSAALDAADSVDVIVMLRDPAHTERVDREQRRLSIARLHDAALARWQRDFSLSRRFQHTPALAGRVTRAALEQLAADPDVAHVQTAGQVADAGQDSGNTAGRRRSQSTQLDTPRFEGQLVQFRGRLDCDWSQVCAGLVLRTRDFGAYRQATAPTPRRVRCLG